MKIKYLIAVLMLLLPVSMSKAADTDKLGGKESGAPTSNVLDWRPHGSLSVNYQSAVLKNRVSRNLFDEPVITADLTVDLTAGFFVNIYGMVGTDDNTWGDNFGDEGPDFTLGWKGKIADVDVKLNTSYVNFNPADTVAGTDWLIVWGTASKTFNLGEGHTLRPELRVDYINIVDWFPSSGAFVLLPSVTHEWKGAFGIPQLTTFEMVGLQYNQEFLSNNESAFFQYGFGARWNVGSNITLTLPGVFGYIPFEEPGDGRKADVMIYSGITFKF
ncbi:MAG: hypothetical protein V4519_03060 [Patescibacteria group bacterium]